MNPKTTMLLIMILVPGIVSLVAMLLRFRDKPARTRLGLSLLSLVVAGGVGYILWLVFYIL